MELRSMRDAGAAVRAERRRQGLTQAALAGKLGVGRDWVSRLENGATRLEAQAVLDAFAVLGIPLRVEPRPEGTSRAEDVDPFASVFAALT